MRTHREIIDTPKFKAVIEGEGVPIYTVEAWRFQNHIPGEFWWLLHQRRVAPLKELARSVDYARRGKPSPTEAVVQSWHDANRIPDDYWWAMERQRVATLKELALAADRDRRQN